MIVTTAPDPVTRALAMSIEGGTVLAAVSGGPDSMAMFHALCELAHERSGLRVIAAHFDHRLRPDSHLDIETVERVAGQFGVRVVCESGDVAAHARASRQSIETAARELRYAFLERAAGETGADVIATAHTRSDHVETVLMRILRGADARGLRGIAARRGRIARPLLSVTRSDTIEYCDTRGVSYVNDPGNIDRRFFRNRVRHDVLPSLRRVYPGLDAALESIADSARSNFDEAERATRPGPGSLLRAEGADGWTLSLAAFNELDDGKVTHVLSTVLDMIAARDNVTRAHYASLLRLVRDDAPGAGVDLPGLRVRREHDGLVFTRRDAGERTMEAIELGVPGSARIGEWTLTAHRISGAEARAAIPRREADVAYIAADGPLTVRVPRRGDRMRPFGMSGQKKLSDIFIDRKIPRRERARTPVIEAGGVILWVAGVATSELARVDGHTPGAIRIAVTRNEVEP